MFTSSDIEFNFGLSSGTVRQYIRNHPELVLSAPGERGFFKIGNTWACSVAFAREIWGKHDEVEVEMMPVTMPDMVITHTGTGTVIRVSNGTFDTMLPDGLTLDERQAVNKWQAIITEAFVKVGLRINKTFNDFV